MNYYMLSVFSLLERGIDYEHASAEDKRMFDEGFMVRTQGFVRSVYQLNSDQTPAIGELEEDAACTWYAVPKENEHLVQPLHDALQRKTLMEFVGRIHYMSAQHSPTERDGLVYTLESIASPLPELPPVEMRKRRFK